MRRVLCSIAQLALAVCPAPGAEEGRDRPLGPIGGVFRMTGGANFVRISSLTPGAPGAAAGLQVDDHIYGAFGEEFDATGAGYFGAVQDLGLAIERAEVRDGHSGDWPVITRTRRSFRRSTPR
jgi:hypothetical protein